MNYLYALCASGITSFLGDLIALGIIVAFVLICARKGFINCLFKFISTVVAIVIAFSFAKTFVSITGGLFGLQTFLETSFIEASSSLDNFNVDISGQNIEELLATHDVSALITTLVLKNYTNIEVPAGTTLAMLVGESAAIWATALIAGIVLFVLVKLLMLLLRKIITAIIKRISLINILNRLLGAAVGLLEALLLISMLASLFSLFNSAAITSFMADSVILTWLANNNPIVWLLGLFL